jgi:hypothetical protein
MNTSDFSRAIPGSRDDARSRRPRQHVIPVGAPRSVEHAVDARVWRTQACPPLPADYWSWRSMLITSGRGGEAPGLVVAQERTAEDAAYTDDSCAGP